MTASPRPDRAGPPRLDRAQLAGVAERWISLWTVPVDWALFDALHADDFADRSSAGRPATKAGFATGLRVLTEAFPDLRTRIDDLVIDAARQCVAVRWSAEGTNRVAFGGIGPTGRLTRLTGIEIIELRGPAIVSRWGEWDITEHALG